MKESLQPGIEHELRFRVPQAKVVGELYPEAAVFQAMPRVFATGFLVGLLEWACIEAVNPHLDWPLEQTVGTHIDISHESATPPGLEVAVHVRLLDVAQRRLIFAVEAGDDTATISRGRHERFIVDRDRFSDRAARKQRAVAHGHEAER